MGTFVCDRPAEAVPICRDLGTPSLGLKPIRISALHFPIDSPRALARVHSCINSGGHFEEDNLQVVRRSMKMWKGSSPDRKFRCLPALLRAKAIEFPQKNRPGEKGADTLPRQRHGFALS